MRKARRSRREQVEVAIEGGWGDRGAYGEEAVMTLRLTDPTNGRMLAELEIPEETVYAAMRNRRSSDLPLAKLDIAPHLIGEWGYVHQLVTVQLPMKSPAPARRSRVSDEQARSDFLLWVKLMEPGNMANDGWHPNDSTYNGRHANHVEHLYTMTYHRYVEPGTPAECRLFPDAEVRETHR